MVKSAKPIAKGPIIPNEGSPMATAYTTDTSTNVMTVSQPNNIPAVHMLFLMLLYGIRKMVIAVLAVVQLHVMWVCARLADASNAQGDC